MRHSHLKTVGDCAAASGQRNITGHDVSMVAKVGYDKDFWVRWLATTSWFSHS